jgi:hypothetical protein
MSRFFTATATCPTCSSLHTLDYPSSINADRRDDLRAAILDGSLFTLPCAECRERLVFEPTLTYLDMARGQWMVAEPSGATSHWRESEAEAARVHKFAFGASAPGPARALGARIMPRLVFGWPAPIEKLRCQELGIDDWALEITKLLVIRDGPERTWDASLDLRLRAREDETLLLDWLNPATGAPSSAVSVPLAVYRSVADGGDSWTDLRALLAGGIYVDLGRVTRDTAAADSAA